MGSFADLSELPQMVGLDWQCKSRRENEMGHAALFFRAAAWPMLGKARQTAPCVNENERKTLVAESVDCTQGI